MGHFRCGTGKLDDGSLQLEDAMAIPDLIAGALSEQFNLPDPGFETSKEIFWMFRPDMSDKTASITSWFYDKSSPLKKLLVAAKPELNGDRSVVSVHHLYNQIDVTIDNSTSPMTF